MTSPAFWWRRPGLAAHLLAPLGTVVSAVTLRRMEQPGARLPVPVICIGNPTVGGSGKTPMVQVIVTQLAAAGRRPVILLRGHGGTEKGPVTVDIARHRPADVGDEALLHARVATTIVSADRLAGAEMAVAAGADIIVMDDGFQNPSVQKSLSILMIDAVAGVGNGMVVPSGPLRARLQPQIHSADVIVIVGQGSAGDAIADLAIRRHKRVFHAAFRIDDNLRPWLTGRDVLAFCGIGRPEKFAETLAAAGARNTLLRPFPDHHTYSEADAARLSAESRATGLDLVTTMKDAVKLCGGPARDELARNAHIMPAAMHLEDMPTLISLIMAAKATDIR